MSSANSQTIETLEEVLVTVQREIDRLRSNTVTMPPPAAKVVSPAPASVPPPPPVAAATAPKAKTWEREGVTINSPRFTLSPELAFRFGGISLVVLSAIFFVSTAINREWIGPTAQLILATLVSFGFIAQSFRFDQRRWRTTFAAGGAAGLFISGVVGHLGLDILSMTAATAWLAVSVVAFLGLARIHSAQVLAVLAAPATFIGSMLLMAAGVDSPAVIASTSAVWTLVLASTCQDQGWSIARAAGVVVAGFLVLIAASASAVAVGPVLVAVAAIGLLAFQQAVELQKDQDGSYRPSAAIEARVFAMFFPGVALTLALVLKDATLFSRAGDDLTGWTVLTVGIVGGLLATVAPKIDRLMVTLHQLAGLSTAAVGLAIIIQGPALLVGLLGATVVSAALARTTKLVEATGLALMLGALVMTWGSVIVLFGLVDDGLTLGEAMATGTVIASLYIGLWFIRHRDDLPTAAGLSWVATLLWVAALWQAAPQAQMWISISWAAMSVGLLASRSLWNVQLAQQHFAKVINLALGTLAVTGLKLVFIDLVAVDILWRAALFFVIGGTFLRLAFVLPGMLGGQRPAAPSTTSEATSSEQLV